jgi:hypothetical protein
MANSDELLYRVKFEADKKSAEEAGKVLSDELAKAQSGGGKADGGSKKRTEDNEKEVSVLKQLREELKGKREELAKLNEASREGIADTNTLREAQQELGASITNISQRLQEANKGYSDQQTVLSSIPNTYNELVEQNRALSIAMKSVPLDDTTGELQSLQERYKANNDQLKAFDATMGNSQRNVGDYENSIRSAANALAIFQGPLGPIAGRINAFATFMSRLGGSTKDADSSIKAKTASVKASTGAVQADYNGYGKQCRCNQANTASQKINTAAIKAKTASLGLLKLAYSAVLGGVILAGIGVQQFLTRTEEGQQRARVGMAGFMAGVDTLREQFINLGRVALNTLDGIRKTVGLLRGIDPVNRAVRALVGYFREGEGVLGANVQRATVLAKRLNDILVIERELGVERSEMNKNLAEAREIARDQTISIEERINALDRVKAAEDDLFKSELQNEQHRLRVFEERRDMFSSDEEQLQAVADQQAKINDMQTAASQRAMSALRDRNTLERQLAQQRERFARIAFEADQLRSRLSLDENITNLRRQGEVERAFAMERAQIGADAQDRIRRVADSLKASMPSITDAEAVAGARIQVEAEIAEEAMKFENMVAEHRRTMQSAMRANEIDIARRQGELLLSERTAQLERQGRFVEAAEMRLSHVQMDMSDEIARRRDDLVRSGYDKEQALTLATTQVQMEMAEKRFNAEQELYASNLQTSLALRSAQYDAEQSLAEVALANQVRLFEMRNDRVAILEAERTLIGIDADRRIQESRESLIAQGVTDEAIILQHANIIKAQIAQQLADKELQIERAKFAQKKEMLDSSIQLAKNAGNALFGDHKAVAVAGAIMDTYSGIVGALAMKPWTPINYVNAAAVGAAGIANVRKLLAVKKDSKSATISTTAPQTPNVGTSFGLVDVGTNANAMSVAGMAGMNRGEGAPTFVFTGDLDPEFMAIKVRQGNNSIAGRTVAVG